MKLSRKRIIQVISVCLVLGTIINLLMICYYYLAQVKAAQNNSHQVRANQDSSNLQIIKGQSQFVVQAQENVFHFAQEKNIEAIKMPKGHNTPSPQQKKQPTILSQQQSKKLYQLEPVGEIDRKNITKKELWELIQKRIGLGQPNPPQNHISFYVIEGSQRSHLCSMINTVTLITPPSIKLAKSILSNLEVKWMIFVVDKSDKISMQYLSQSFQEEKIGVFDANLDYNYQFLLKLVQKLGCEQFIYINNQIQLNLEATGQTIKNTIKQCQSFTVCYSSKVMEKNSSLQYRSVDLTRLQIADLSKIKTGEYNKYIFVIDTRFFHFITPLNFLHFSLYTFQEIILIPTLAISQKISRLRPFSQVIHKYDQFIDQFKYFSFSRAQINPINFCFVSYPLNPHKQDSSQMERYLDGIQKIASFNPNISLVVYLPYGQTSRNTLIDRSLYRLHKLKKENLIEQYRVILKDKKIGSALSVYESIYNYCSWNSVVVVSRHSTQLSVQLGKSMVYIKKNTEKSLFVGCRSCKKDRMTENLEKKKQIQIYRQLFFNIQIFKSELFRKIHYFYLKKGLIELFQTQYSYLLPLLIQAGETNLQYFDEDFTRNSRKQSSVQLQQLQFIKYEPNHLNQSFLHSFLLNKAYQSKSKLKIEKNLHFISTQNECILSPKLKEYIELHYSDYQIYTWGIADLIKGSFPLTSFKINQIIEKDKSSFQYIRLLMGLQAIYYFGGFIIPIDCPLPKPESLIQFLRYEFFLGWRPSKTQTKPLYPVIGSTQNNYHLSILLKQMIDFLPYSFNEFEVSQLIQSIFSEKQKLISLGYGYPSLFQQSLQICKKFTSSSPTIDTLEEYSLSICT